MWQDTRINIVELATPPGSEVERVLKTVDGVMLLVDAAEGPCHRPALCSRRAWG